MTMSPDARWTTEPTGRTTSRAEHPGPAKAPRDLRRFWRIAAAVALPVGPAVITLGRMMLPYWTTDSSPRIVDGIITHAGWMELSQWLAMASFPALLIGVLALYRLARRGSPVLATVGGTLAFIAYANWGAGGNTELLVLAGHAKGVDAATLVTLGDAVQNHPISLVAGLGWVIGHILGTVLLGIALYRSRAVPRWAAALLAVSQPLHLIAAVIVPSKPLDFIGWGGTTLACLVAAVVIARTPNDAWDLPPVAARTT